MRKREKGGEREEEGGKGKGGEGRRGEGRRRGEGEEKTSVIDFLNFST